MAYGGYKEYETIAQKKARAAKSVEKLKKKNKQLSPIVCTGRKLAITWWGSAWNENLERYADFSNRISRGRNYLRQGAVLDLQIAPGQVTALVQGSRIKPYQVVIKIHPLNPDTWQDIVKACAGSIHSFQDLISGRFPKTLVEIFTARGTGLFPSPREIAMSCSCPDWAGMCKHIAAVLYGIGVRFDEDPLLFFHLRQANFDELITLALDQTTQTLLDRADNKSMRSLEHTDLSELFAIDFADSNEPVQPLEIAPAPPAAERKKRGRPRKT